MPLGAARIAAAAFLAVSAPVAMSALSCADYASLAASSAIYRELGVPEQQLVETIPTIIVSSLADHERVTVLEIIAAQEMARSVHRSKMTARDAARMALRACSVSRI